MTMTEKGWLVTVVTYGKQLYAVCIACVLASVAFLIDQGWHLKLFVPDFNQRPPPGPWTRNIQGVPSIK